MDLVTLLNSRFYILPSLRHGFMSMAGYLVASQGVPGTLLNVSGPTITVFNTMTLSGTTFENTPWNLYL